MDEESRPERISPVYDEAKIDAGQYRAECFQFRLAEMHDYEGYHLHQYAAFFKTVFKAENEKTTEQEF